MNFIVVKEKSIRNHFIQFKDNAIEYHNINEISNLFRHTISYDEYGFKSGITRK